MRTQALRFAASRSVFSHARITGLVARQHCSQQGCQRTEKRTPTRLVGDDLAVAELLGSPREQQFIVELRGRLRH